MKMENLKNIYFLGIGGIGMSALARFFNNRGIRVSGYDKVPSELTEALESEGMHIWYDEDPAFIPPGIDLVILTPAIPKDHQGLLWFQKEGLPIKKRAEVLGLISQSKKTVAIAGTHGKTTTSSITAHILRQAGEDCSAFLGGIAANFNSNFVDGSSDWVVVEADEFDRSFLHLHPDIAVILSMDPDHLDIYGSPEEILAGGYQAFARQIKKGGKVLVNVAFSQNMEKQDFQTIGFEKSDFHIQNVRVAQGQMVFNLEYAGRVFENLEFPIPGRHNVFNAATAFAVGILMGLPENLLRKGLQSFQGIKRRFEILYQDDNRVYIDDYAHHPTELEAAISAARHFFPGKKITGVFQPHLFSRTRDFLDGFAQALALLDVVLLLEIYPAREKPIPGIHSELLLGKIESPQKHLLSKDQLLPFLEAHHTEVLMTLGAGDIDRFRQPILQFFKNQKQTPHHDQ